MFPMILVHLQTQTFYIKPLCLAQHGEK